MTIHTIEDNFDYQCKEICKKFIADYEDAIREGLAEGKDFDNLLWEHRKDVGQYFIERMNEYLGDAEQLMSDELEKFQQN